MAHRLCQGVAVTVRFRAGRLSCAPIYMRVPKHQCIFILSTQGFITHRPSIFSVLFSVTS